MTRGLTASFAGVTQKKRLNSRLNREGLAYRIIDYCVFWSATDGKNKGFETFVLPELCKSIDEGTTEKAKKAMMEEGIQLISLKDIE